MSLIDKLISREIDKQQELYGVPMDHMRFLARAARPSLFAMRKAMGLLHYRKTLPVAAAAVAHIAAAKVHDCGSCVQIAVNLSRRAGVPRELLEAVAAGRVDSLPGSLAAVYRYAETVASGEDSLELRGRLTAEYGEAGLAELALTIAAAGYFPTLKRGLGHAVSCSRVTVAVE